MKQLHNYYTNHWTYITFINYTNYCTSPCYGCALCASLCDHTTKHTMHIHNKALYVISHNEAHNAHPQQGTLRDITQRSTQCTSTARHSSQYNITQHCMLPQHPTCKTKLICDYFWCDFSKDDMAP